MSPLYEERPVDPRDANRTNRCLDFAYRPLYRLPRMTSVQGSLYREAAVAHHNAGFGLQTMLRFRKHSHP